jgi:hypothetical protein
MTSDERRGLLEYVGNVVDEQLHDLDPGRAQGRLRLQAMLTRCARTKEPDSAFIPFGRFRKVTP